MYPRMIAPLLCFLFLALPPCTDAGDSQPSAGWDQALDKIQAWTWSERTELNSRLEKEETRTGQGLAANISAWEQRMNVPATGSASGSADSRVILKDEVYRRVTAAKTVQYLRNGDRKSLAEGIQLSERFAGKLMQTEYAFWYYYARALADIEANNGDAFQKDAFALLNNVILWGEPTLSGWTGRIDPERSHYSWNLADLIINRAIIQRRLAGLEPLGVIIWMLDKRSGSRGTSHAELEQQRLISGVKQHLTGPESDNMRLNYAVAMHKVGQHRTLLFSELDGRGRSEVVREHFSAASEYLQLAYSWAGTVQGRITAAAACLDLENSALERMTTFLPPAILAALVDTPGRIDPNLAVRLFGELAGREQEQDGWKQLGFSDRKAYVQGAHRLWSALQRRSLLASEFQFQRIDQNNYRSIADNSAATEKPLLGYVQLFRTYTAGGHREIMPESAYFAYAESMKQLARLKRLSLAYGSDMDSYRQAGDFLLQGAAIYPYDGSIADYAANSMDINTGNLNLLPDRVLAGIVANDVVSGCLQGDDSISSGSARESLRWSTYKIRNKLYGQRGESRQDEITALLAAWKGSPAVKGQANRTAADESKLIARGRQFQKEARLLGGQITAAEQEAVNCRIRWQSCAAGKPPAAFLLDGRNRLEKTKNGLLLEADRFNDNRTKSGLKAAEFAAGLARMTEDEFVQLSDRIFALESVRLKAELARLDDHPMHRSIRNGFYRIRQPAGY
jgi:hypothetical protein